MYLCICVFVFLLQLDCKRSQLVLQLAVPHLVQPPTTLPLQGSMGKQICQNLETHRQTLQVSKARLWVQVQGELWAVGWRGGGRAGGGAVLPALLLLPASSQPPASTGASSSFTAASLCAPVSQGTMPGWPGSEGLGVGGRR